MKSKESGIHTKHTQVLSNLFEFQLKRGHLITVLLKLSLDLAIAGVLTNDDSYEPTLSSGNLGAGKEDRCCDIMRATLLATELSQFFTALSHASVIGLLLKFIGLTSHCGLISKDTRGSKNYTIDGDVHACLDLQDVTNNDLTDVDGLLLTITSAMNLFCGVTEAK